MSAREALLQLLRELQARDYRFTAVTPATHAQVLARPLQGPPTLRDIFGWNRQFASNDLDGDLLSLLEEAAAVEERSGALRSKLRVASIGNRLFLHSGFPTDERDSVFFGPDTYRFARFVEQQLPNLHRPSWIVEMGAGTGACGIIAAKAAPGTRVTLVDINAAALSLAEVNAAHAGVEVDLLKESELPAGADLVLANPPYMMDPEHRSYRDGGGLLGGALALDWVEQALSQMAPGGTMLLYTGAAYVDGEAPLLNAIADACSRAGAALSLNEIDPDVFGDELQQPAYREVERIAAVGAVIRRSH